MKLPSTFRILSKYGTPLKFLNSTLFLNGVSLITGFVTYRYVEPQYVGIWATFTVFATIATFLRLGIPNGMNRQLPYYLGKGEIEKAESYASTTLFYSLFTMLVMSIIAILFLLTFHFDSKGDLSDAYKWAAIVFFTQVVLEPYSTYLSGTFRTSSNFNKLSNIQFYLGVYRLISILFVVFWGFAGYLIREFCAYLLNSVLLHLYRPMPQIRARFEWEVFKDLFKIGFSIFIVSYITSFIDTIPRLFVIKNGTSLDMGLFSPSLIVISMVILIPNTISNYLYPKFSYAYGEGCQRVYFWDKTKKMLLASLGLGLICALAVFFLVDKVIFIFPKYVDSLPYIKMSCLAVSFIGYKLTDVVCVVLKEFKWLWAKMTIYGVSILLSILILHSTIDDIIAVAACSIGIANAIQYITSFIVIYAITHKRELAVDQNLN